MLPTIKKILYATDMSENSRLAFGYAMSLAKQYQAQLVVLHVNESVNPNVYTQIGGAMGKQEWLNYQEDYEHGLYDSLGTKIREFGRQMEIDLDAINIKNEDILIRKGMSVDEILSTASEHVVDIIVMGTHGYGMVKDALMGGTARRVIRRSEKPVFVVRNPEKE